MSVASHPQVAERSRPGCASISLLVVGGVLTSSIVVLVLYLRLGVESIADRAQAESQRIDRALLEVPLATGADLVNVSRYPRDVEDAATAVRADRLGDAISFWVYCGDQCPAWEPSDAVTVHHSYDTPTAADADGSTDCARQRPLLRAIDFEEIAIASIGYWDTRCSFEGCIGEVGIRVDVRDSGIALWGAIGPVDTDLVGPPDCTGDNP